MNSLNDSQSTDSEPIIDIENFERKEFKDSRHVLTSPRSLVACENLNIKPNELVSESLANTFSEIGTKNATLSLVYQIFSKKELERRVKVSQVRLERLNLIQREKDSIDGNSLKSFYNDSFQSASLNALYSKELLDNLVSKRLKERELLSDNKLESNEIEEFQPFSSSVMSFNIDRDRTYEKSNYEDLGTRSRYLEVNESFDPYFYTRKYPQKPIFDMKSLSLAKQAINDAQFNKTRENSRMINNQTKDYYETKLVNKMNSLDNAAENKRKHLYERSMRIFLDRQEKFKLHEMKTRKNEHDKMMKSLVNISKIRNKDDFIDAKARNNSLRVYDLEY